MSAGRSSGRGRHQLHRNDRAQLRTAAPAVDTSTLNRGLLIPLQQRTARRGLQGYSRFIGRVGALAVALGVGVGFTTSMPGVARADDTDSSSSAESSSSEPSDPSRRDRHDDVEPRPLRRPTLPRRRIPHPPAIRRPKLPRGLCRARAAPRPEATGPTPPRRVRKARPTRCQPHPAHRRVASRRRRPRRPTRLPRRRPTRLPRRRPRQIRLRRP